MFKQTNSRDSFQNEPEIVMPICYFVQLEFVCFSPNFGFRSKMQLPLLGHFVSTINFLLSSFYNVFIINPYKKCWCGIYNYIHQREIIHRHIGLTTVPNLLKFKGVERPNWGAEPKQMEKGCPTAFRNNLTKKKKIAEESIIFIITFPIFYETI